MLSSTITYAFFEKWYRHYPLIRIKKAIFLWKLKVLPTIKKGIALGNSLFLITNSIPMHRIIKQVLYSF